MSVPVATAPEAAHRGPWRAVRALRAFSWRNFALRWAVLAVLLSVWQLAAVALDDPFFPPPMEILQRAAALWLPDESGLITASMARDVLPSITRALLGFGVALLVAVTLGVSIGLSRSFGDYVDPIVQFLRAIPPPALIPIFLVIFGTGDQMRVLLIAFGTLWPMLLNTIEGVRSIDELKYNTAEVFKIPLRDRLTRIVLPGAAPKILAGVRTSLALALILMVLSEMIASSGGIGYTIVQAQRSFALLDMWAGIVLLGIIGYLLNLGLTLVERRILLWQRSSGRETA